MRYRGIVKHVDSERGFGFIAREGNTDIYFHIKEVMGLEIKKGWLVEFIESANNKGPMAVNIVIIKRS